jgi:hypothetical protein
MRNVLRLETKGCVVDELTGGENDWWKRSVGGEGCLCDLPDKGGAGGEAMGNPLGNPVWPRLERERDEVRRGEKEVSAVM